MFLLKTITLSEFLNKIEYFQYDYASLEHSNFLFDFFKVLKNESKKIPSIGFETISINYCKKAKVELHFLFNSQMKEEEIEKIVEIFQEIKNVEVGNKQFYVVELNENIFK